MMHICRELRHRACRICINLISTYILLQDWYSQSFRDLMEFDEGKLKEPDDEALAKFCQTLKTIQTRHTNVVQTMAQGVLELKDSHPVYNLKILSLSVIFSFIPGL